MLAASNEKPFSVTQGAVPVKTLSFEAKAPGASRVIGTAGVGGSKVPVSPTITPALTSKVPAPEVPSPLKEKLQVSAIAGIKPTTRARTNIHAILFIVVRSGRASC